MATKQEQLRPPQDKVQGEGDYDAARRYRKEVDDFIQHENVEEVARRAKPKSAAEERDLALAEDQGKARSKGDDPADIAGMYPGKKSLDVDR